MKKFQQGDVVMFQVDKETYEKNIRDNDRTTKYIGGTNTKAILAFGEVTGHTHRVNMNEMLQNAGITLNMGWNGTAGKDVPEGFIVENDIATLKHEEHNPVDISPGYYLVRIVREMDHITGRARYVAD